MRIVFTLQCCLCESSTSMDVDVPNTWGLSDGAIEVERSLCPTHQAIQPFVDAQCPGCVGVWTDCDLWRAFAYRERGLTDDDLSAIAQGRCPKRTNGSFVVERRGPHATVTEEDLSSPAPNAAGQALAQAIEAYWEQYVPT